VNPDAPNVLDAMVQLEQARTRAKATNKLALDAEKEKDAAEQEVQRLQQLLQAKRARTHETWSHWLCEFGDAGNGTCCER
jgi:hypothetical protein